MSKTIVLFGGFVFHFGNISRKFASDRGTQRLLSGKRGNRQMEGVGGSRKISLEYWNN